MSSRITGFLKEYVFGLSIIVTIIGFIILFMGVIWYGFREVEIGFYTDIIHQLEEWNAYLLVIGLIIFGIGVYYLYSYLKNRKFFLEELETKKRSEFLKKHGEIRDTVRNLPSKYMRMLEEKEEELGVK
ncbi:MAG: hypothetical protein JSW60_06235 [Thermoplasmatales archaeon]|nr:MAG: hypothetical protein JSW60_06235 [Thermoplasmatales archaeon]